MIGSLLVLIGFVAPAQAQRGAFKATITPHWSVDNMHFWYRNDLAGGKREFVLVDVAKGQRKPAFDHARLAAALKAAGVDDSSAERLGVDDLEFNFADNTLLCRAGGRDWRCALDAYELKRVEDRKRPAANEAAARVEDVPRASIRNGPQSELEFDNRSGGEVELFWLDSAGQRKSYGKLAVGGQRSQHTFSGHVWEGVAGDGRSLHRFQAGDQPTSAIITGRAETRPRRPDGRQPPRAERDVSPDGKWRAFVRDNNLFVRAGDGEQEKQITQDGAATNSYQMPQWSPDSQTLVAFRVEPGEDKQVHLIESSPQNGGRANLRSRGYPLPGDKFTAYELHLFHAGDWKPAKPEVERIDFGRPRLRWNRDGRRFTFEKIDRGHQRFRVFEVDSQTAAVRTLLDEKTDTFIWSQHNETGALTTYLQQTAEIIYVSERDGWKHLYLVDAEQGKIANQITQGHWIVRGVERIDEAKRQIWFRASGMFPGQDPYLIHFCRVNFDGSGLVALTAGNGSHAVRYSPDGQHLIGTYSRVDLAPVHELRRVADGSLVCDLETADISELASRGFETPEVFVAKGRDGVTDIWGIICRPPNFDAGKMYPVIEAIYAGPQDSFVPKSFSGTRQFANMTDLGFVVAKIDGMGTANRSKAFHDVCWKNLKDAGFPDRILWHQAVAAKYSWYDISRVGIYGGSVGGQNSTGAVLFHPEFYKVAVSSCGCHDNRMDKASWNEQWMGFPVGPQYAESSNIDNAHRLRGKLLLIVGELDTNVPPESTLRLSDALIKAGKDFDLLVIPGAGHGDGGRYGERRRQDFFLRHLQGVEPPDRNAASR